MTGNPAHQRSFFDMAFDMPSGPENIHVEITGFKNPRALLTVLAILGSPENIQGTRDDILQGQAAHRAQCPLAVLAEIEQSAG